VEKYLPLKLQHQLSETVGECFPRKQKQKFYEISRAMAEVLRQDILKDSGVSRFKTKVLDLITALRVEVDLLNHEKTGKAEYHTNCL